MLTRYREQLMGDRTREAMRLELMLEDASIKLSVVASSLTTVSVRAMLAALIDGERDPRALAELAKGRMRVKIPALTEALTGHFDTGHAAAEFGAQLFWMRGQVAVGPELDGGVPGSCGLVEKPVPGGPLGVVGEPDAPSPVPLLHDRPAVHGLLGPCSGTIRT